ncbi:MAG: hypothetical protein ABIJ03_01685 [Patescibacteria group bacterium]|nr:hypothetical protein [Patescibacteria group bacterium]
MVDWVKEKTSVVVIEWHKKSEQLALEVDCNTSLTTFLERKIKTTHLCG